MIVPEHSRVERAQKRAAHPAYLQEIERGTL